MKKFLLAAIALVVFGADGSALAADLPNNAPIYRPPSVEVISWTGLYFGGHFGYGGSSTNWRLLDQTGGGITPFNLGSGAANGGLGGVQVGVNWQTGPMVFGIEADFSVADISGEACNVALAATTILCSSKVDRFGTITGRIGGAFDRTLVYMKAGGAWMHDTHTLSLITGPAQVEDSTSKSKWGWTAGAGIEYALTRNWSAKIEYDFLTFDTERYDIGSALVIGTDIKQQIHAIKFGWNYKLDWSSPAVAKY